MKRRYAEVDVFGAEPYRGNPLAVVIDSEGLDADEMLGFANWTNLSETVFLLPPSDPTADYLARIFTPAGELPFAGHPTLGACHTWLEFVATSSTTTCTQECGVGLIKVRQTEGRLAFKAPPLTRDGSPDDGLILRAAAILNIDASEIIDCEWIDNGPGWLGVLLESAAAVLRIRPGNTDIDIGIAGPHPAGSSPAWEIRAFFPKDGATAEDPVTGSLNASMAQWLLRTKRVTAPYVAAQGTALGRAGRVFIDVDETGHVWVGGSTRTCVVGTVEL